MDDLNTLIYTGYILAGVIFTIFFICCMISIATRVREYKLLKADYRLEQVRIDRNTDLDRSVFEILDKIIDDTFNEYILLNYAYNTHKIISADDEEIICREICDLVAERVSPLLRTKSCLIYNEASFDSLLAQKIYIRTMAYALESKKIK